MVKMTAFSFCHSYQTSLSVKSQRRYDMRHEMLTQRALFCIESNTKKGALSQQFVTHVAPPLVKSIGTKNSACQTTPIFVGMVTMDSGQQLNPKATA